MTGNITYIAGAGDNNIISTGPAVLERVIIGKDVSSAVVEVSDDSTDGDGNIVLQLDGSTLMTANGGVVEVGAVFKKGISANLTNQTQVTFIWYPDRT